MEEKVSKLNSYFEERIAVCDLRNRELMGDERKDEAVFEKVRANVYDIFRTILSAALKACKGDPEAVRRFFEDRIAQIPAGWAASYESAKAHGDVVKLRIEEIKLATVEEIKENFAAIWEGEQ